MPGSKNMSGKKLRQFSSSVGEQQSSSTEIKSSTPAKCAPSTLIPPKKKPIVGKSINQKSVDTASSPMMPGSKNTSGKKPRQISSSVGEQQSSSTEIKLSTQAKHAPSTRIPPKKKPVVKKSILDDSVENILDIESDSFESDSENEDQIKDPYEDLFDDYEGRKIVPTSEQEENEYDDDSSAVESEIHSGAEHRYNIMDHSLKLTEDLDDEIVICSKRTMNDLLKNSQVKCSKCHDSNMQFRMKYLPKGNKIEHSISFYCGNCEKDLFQTQTSEKIKLPREGREKNEKWTYKNSIQFALGTLSSGTTYEEGTEFLKHLCSIPPSHQSYLRLMKQASSIFNNKLMAMKDRAAEKVKEHYVNKGLELSNEAMDITVVFDGTWLRRSSSSNYGVAFVIDAETELILDAHMSSSFCLSSAKAKTEFKKDPAGYTEWKENHRKSCDCNYASRKSSGQMETEAAKILFERSLKRGLRYKTIVADKHSTTYKAICESNPYDGCHIKNFSCANHVAKKIYEKLVDGLGRCSRTQNISNSFANFYRFAIREHIGNVTKVRELMNASIDHHISTDEKPLHNKCSPKWCSYKKASMEGIPVAPAWHNDVRNRKFVLSEKAGQFIKDVIKEMSTKEMLSKVSGITEFNYESIHSKLWNLLPKSGIVEGKHFQFYIVEACLDYNSGRYEFYH